MRFPPPRGASPDSPAGEPGRGTLGGRVALQTPPMPVLRSSELLHVSSVGMTPKQKGRGP